MKRILIADDDVQLREAFRAVMEVDGFTVWEAGSLEEALQLVAEREFDVVLSDVYMPGSGLELLGRLRRISPGCSVVLITGYYKAPDESVAMEQGAYAYLRKPLSLDLLRETMRQALAVSENRHDGAT